MAVTCDKPPSPAALIHVLLIEKQPPVRLIPCDPVEVALRLKRVKSRPPVKVVVAAEPKVAAPVEPLKKSAATEEVAVRLEVAKYKLFAMERNVHALLLEVVSTRASCGPLEATVSDQSGDVVPTPTLPPINVAEMGLAAVVDAT